MTKFGKRLDDEGFSLVEILIAMAIFSIVAASTAPLLLGAIKATQVARYSTQGKNLLQQRLDVIRNLPYHVSQTAGDYVDLLDTYYRDGLGTRANSKCDGVSVTTATSTYNCHLASSRFPQFPGFVVDVAAQFVDQNRLPVVPPAGYDSQSTSADVPPSGTLRLVLTVGWSAGGRSHTFSAETLRSGTDVVLPQTVARIRSTAVNVTSTLDDQAIPTVGQFGIGIVNADTGLSVGATARATVQGALTTYSSGETSAGQAQGSLNAPPDQPSFTTVTGAASTGVPCGDVACFGPTQVANVVGTANGGAPQVASAAAPLTASLTKSGAAGTRGGWFTNVPAAGAAQSKLVRLRVQSVTSPPTAGNPTRLLSTVQNSNAGYVPQCTSAGTATSNADFASTQGYVTTSGGSGHSVVVCSTATARRFDLFPTDFAPNGVVQVVLDWAGVQCTASNATTPASAAAVYHATINYFVNGAYQSLTATTGGADPLAPSLLARGAGGIKLGYQDPTGAELYLGDYLKSWSSGTVINSSSGRTGQVDLKVVSLTTQATRDADTTDASSLQVVFGDLGCLAQDNR